MRKRTKVITGCVAVLATIGVGTGLAVAANQDDDATDTPITGAALVKASAAALARTGGGTVTETEVGDEESYYQVEVTLDDGTKVDVQLDRSFKVVGQKADHESGSDDGSD